jgi:succinate dehydrogenase flavin-adding protein (antitoxin of CptAB toxin-antitoxin module)
MKKPPYTRRDVQRLSEEIRGEYRELLMKNDVEGFKKLLAQYPTIDEDKKNEMIENFKQYAVRILRNRWRLSK